MKAIGFVAPSSLEEFIGNPTSGDAYDLWISHCFFADLWQRDLSVLASPKHVANAWNPVDDRSFLSKKQNTIIEPDDKLSVVPITE